MVKNLMWYLCLLWVFPVHATQLLTNFNGYHTPASQIQHFSAMVIDDGKVLAIGTHKQLIDNYPKAQVVDLQGKTLLPGLIDGHGHVTWLGNNLGRVSLRGLKSAAQSVIAVQDFATKNPSLSWIIGTGWNQELWPNKRYPTKELLDPFLSDKPVWLRRIDGHAAWANSKVLALAGIDRHTPSPSGGEIVKDSQGEPTGILIDNAMALIDNILPINTEEEIQAAILRAGKHLLSVGITSVHDAGISLQTYRAYKGLANKQQMPLRVYGMLKASDPDYLAMLGRGIITTIDDMYEVRSVKISADGALGSRGAAMLTPYTDDSDNVGLLLQQGDMLARQMTQAAQQGFQVNVHAIGDGANRLVLDHFSKLNQHTASRQLRHRIEHAQVVSVADLTRFKALAVLPSMQPTHATSDMNMAVERIGPVRIKGAYAWKTLLDQGVRVVAGSDFPVEYANPFYGLHAAVTRQDRKNQPTQGWMPQQAITLEQALTAFTLDAAYGAHQESRLGTLEPGKWADFIIINQNIMTQSATSIWSTNVLSTWIAGHKVYSMDDK